MGDVRTAADRDGDTERAELTYQDALPDPQDPMVQWIVEQIGKFAIDLSHLGHSHAYLDANARYFIARHLVAAAREGGAPGWWTA